MKSRDLAIVRLPAGKVNEYERSIARSKHLQVFFGGVLGGITADAVIRIEEENMCVANVVAHALQPRWPRETLERLFMKQSAGRPDFQTLKPADASVLACDKPGKAIVHRRIKKSPAPFASVIDVLAIGAPIIALVVVPGHSQPTIIA